MYHHPWDRPSLIRLTPSGRYTVRQECPTCQTVRNPISGEITNWGTHACRDRPHTPDDPSWDDELRRLRFELEKLEAAGEDVDPTCMRPPEPAGAGGRTP